MAVYGPNMGQIGSSVAKASPCAVGAHNFHREYYYHLATGDVRAYYQDLYFNSTGSGEVLRVRGIVNATGVAPGGTVNAIHATGRVAAAKTVSGAMQAVRATLEVAGTTPTPGGTLAALNVDTNIVTGATMGANDAFIKVSNSGAAELQNLFNITGVTVATDTPTSLVSTHNDHTSSHLIKCRVNGADMWLLATNVHS